LPWHEDLSREHGRFSRSDASRLALRAQLGDLLPQALQFVQEHRVSS
jgi:hypothetical protein